MRKKFWVYTLIITLSLILTGCWDQKIYEQIGFILEVGIEEGDVENEYHITYTSPVFGSTEKEKVEVIHTTSGILRGARENARRMSARQLEGGKIQQIIFSEELAKKGIHQMMEIFERDSTNPTLAWVVIAEGSPMEIFEKGLKFKDKPRIAIYINQLLEGGTKSSYVPHTKVYDFDINYYVPGLDPITPIIKLMPNDVQIVGTALFDGDKMVGKIDTQSTALLLAMKGMMKTTEYITSISNSTEEAENKKKYLAVVLKNAKHNIKVTIKNNKPEVYIKLDFKANLDEYEWDHVGEEAEIKKLEKYLTQAIESQCMEVLQYTQEVGSDPIGIGDIVRAKHNEYWDRVEWKDVYSDITFNVEAKVKIQQYGTVK